MAKAEIKVVFAADVAPLEKAIKKITDQANEVHKALGQVGNNLGKDLTGLDITKLLGIGGAAYAATKLGDALVDAAKRGYEAFQAYQDKVLKFKYNLPSSAGSLEERGKMGADAVKDVGSRAGVFSSTQLADASLSLMQASKEFRENRDQRNAMLDTVTALAIKTGSTPETIAESVRKLNVGIKEEGGMAVGKFFKSTPGLEEQAEKLRDAHAEDYQKSHGQSDAEKSEYQKLKRTPIDEFMTQEAGRVGGTGILDEVKKMMVQAAPKSIIEEEKKIHPEAELNVAIGRLQKAFAQDLAPAIEKTTRVIDEAMPTLTKDVVELSGVLKAVVIPGLGLLGGYLQAIGERMNFFGGAVGGVLTKLMPFSGKTETSNSVDAALKRMGIASDSPMLKGDYKQTPEQSAKGYHPYGDEHAALEKTKVEKAGSFDIHEDEDPIVSAQRDASVKVAEDVAKITAKSDADHLASQHQASYATAQLAFREQTRAAVHNTLAGINPADTSERSVDNTRQLELAAKTIAIKAEAAAKNRALDEDAAVKIAKIEEEKALRKVTRDKEDIGDKTDAEKAARATVRNAEDMASQQSISDLQADAAQRRRDEDQEAADRIIDAQEASAKSQRDTIISAYNDAVSKHEGPYKFQADEGPAQPDTYSKFGKGGAVIEGSFERRQREQANRAGQEATDRANEQYQKQKEMSDLGRVGGIKYDQSGLSGAINITPPTAGKDGAKFDFSKGLTEQTKATLLLESLYNQLVQLNGVFGKT